MLPEGTPVSIGMRLGVPALLLTRTIPIPPACLTRSAFEKKLQ